MPKLEDKGEIKLEDKGEIKLEDKGRLEGILGGGDGSLGSSGWVVVSFIGPAGFDVRRLAAAVLFGGGGLRTRSRSAAIGKAAAEAVEAVRKREATQQRLIKAAVQGKKLPLKRIRAAKTLAKT